MKLSITATKMLNQAREAGSKGIMVNTRDPNLRSDFSELKSQELVKCFVGIGNSLRVVLAPKGKMYFFNKK